MARKTWYRIDNVAKVFLASANERDTRSFRISCTLKEEVDPDLLNAALKMAALDRPQYQVTILRGYFWHYMESTDDIPVATEECDRPCPMLIDYKTFGKLHYRVTYFNNRINLDFSHVIADGNGAIDFLNVIINRYLVLKYPDSFPDAPMFSGASEADRAQDSFKHFHQKRKNFKRLLTQKKAYAIRGAKHPYNQTQFLEIHMPVKDVLAQSKKLNVSLTSYMCSLLMMSIYKDMPAFKRKMPVAISLPVNLRNYYPSQTSRNFFNSINVSRIFKAEDTLEEVALQFNADLKEQLDPEIVAERMDNFEKLETNWFIRCVPLVLKNPVVNFVTRRSAKRVTATYSNLGKLSLPEGVSDYIQSYAAFCSTSTLFIVCSTYKDDLVLGISSAYRNTQILKDFIKNFTDNEIPVTVYSNDIID